MLTLITYLQDLIVSWTILYITYGVARFTRRCFLWSTRSLSFKLGTAPLLHGDRTFFPMFRCRSRNPDGPR
jgi:hypothetical protein